jgi:G3E family GTPase
LGSGKTTLLNHLLSHAGERRMAVLVNEFSELDIDSQWLVNQNDLQLGLGNGCICCSLQADLLSTVYQLLASRQKLDHLLIETSGLADPEPIIYQFLTTQLWSLVRLDAVLTVVDAASFTPDHYGSAAAYSQVRRGDMILLNKTDLLKAAQVEQVEHALHRINPRAGVVRCRYGQVPLPLIWDFSRTRQSQAPFAQNLERWIQNTGHSVANPTPEGFQTVTFESKTPFSLQRFQAFLAQLSSQVYRAKGILWFLEKNGAQIFHLVGLRHELRTDSQNRDPRSRLVFIGRDLEATALRHQLSQCLADDLPVV